MKLQELSWKERGRLWMRMGIRLVLAALVLLLLFLAVPPLISLFMPFVLALVLAWLLNPIVRWLHRKLKLSRRVLSLIIILLAVCVVGGLLFLFVYEIGVEVYSLVSNWDTVGAEIELLLNDLNGRLQHLSDLLPEAITNLLDGAYSKLLGWLQDVVPELLTSAGKSAGNFAMKLPSGVIAAVVFLMASYFITADYPRIRLMATDRMSPGVHSFLSRVRKVAIGAFGGYVRAQLILSLVVFFILLIGFSVVGQRYALLLAFIFAVMDFIPIIGSGTVIVPWTVIDLITGNYREALSLMIIWGFICLFRRVAEPKVVGDQTGLSPILSLISIYVGMRLAGVLGMIFGPVVVLVLLNIFKMDVCSGTRRDLRLAVQDIRALLSTEEVEKKSEE